MAKSAEVIRLELAIKDLNEVIDLLNGIREHPMLVKTSVYEKTTLVMKEITDLDMREPLEADETQVTYG